MFLGTWAPHEYNGGLMSGSNSNTLIQALEKSIRRMSVNFNDDWLITGMRTDARMSDCDNKENLHRYGESYPMDYHSYIEVCVCVEGSFAMIITDNMYEIREGEACIIFPGLMHSESYARDMGHISIWLAFDSNRVTVHLSGNRHQEFFTSDLRTLVSDHEYSSIINSINAEKSYKSPYSNTLFKLHILHILIITLNKIRIDESGEGEGHAYRKKIAEEVKEYIEVNGFKDLYLRDIAQTLYVSAGYLNNIFKSVTGVTILQYIENRRIERAMYLLKNTNESITNISQQLGYYDQYHFSKSFKKAVKESPSQYRKAAWKNIHD
jgi:AraC-like DNA-binding protein/mannose-6-phosphate isomerase-like protein (cupin superfamily)